MAPRSQLIKESVGLLYLIGKQTPPTARESCEVNVVVVVVVVVVGGGGGVVEADA